MDKDGRVLPLTHVSGGSGQDTRILLFRSSSTIIVSQINNHLGCLVLSTQIQGFVVNTALRIL